MLTTKSRVFRITMPSRDVESFLAECEAVSWSAYDSGERIMTEDGPDAETVLLVEPSPRTLPESQEYLTL